MSLKLGKADPVVEHGNPGSIKVTLPRGKRIPEVFCVDLNGTITSARNLGAEKSVTDYEDFELVGSNFSIFFIPEDVERGVPHEMLGRAKSFARHSVRIWLCKKNRQIFLAKMVLKALPKGYSVLIRDQTNQLKLFNRARNSLKNEHLHLFDNPFVGVFKLAIQELRFVVLNERARQVIGTSERLSKLEEIFYYSNDFKIFLEKINSQNEISDFEFRVNRTGEVWAQIDCRRLGASGVIEGVIADVTKRKTQVHELVRLSDEIDNFVYHASHDLRAPLTTLLGLIHLTEHDSRTSIGDYCNMMRERVCYMDELLKEMTFILENSRSGVVNEVVNLNSTVTSLIKELQSSSSNIAINFSFREVNTFCSDKFRVQTILRNILLSCTKLRNPHVTFAYINIEINVLPDKSIIKIQDNGIGIRDDQLIQAFGMFYKIAQVPDTGLKLYIAKLVVDKLGGKIAIDSKLGVGTWFEVELPNMCTPLQ